MLRASRSRMRAHGSRGASVTPYLGDSGGAVVELEATADCASLMWEDAIMMEPSDACGTVRALRQRSCKRGWQRVLNRLHAESKRRM